MSIEISTLCQIIIPDCNPGWVEIDAVESVRNVNHEKCLCFTGMLERQKANTGT